MLTAELRRDIDKKWEACWPVNTLRPLVLIDCICYILFLKKLEDNKLISSTQVAGENKIPCYINDDAELYWSYFKDLDAKNIHILFSKENGITDLLKNYSHTNLPFSNFLKASPLINPSAVLLHNVVEIVKIIESENGPHPGEIFEYLLHKEEIQTSTGQLYAPLDAIDSIISLVQPHEDEIIFDPSCGNGDFLIGVATHISNKRTGTTTGIFLKNLAGGDDDPVQLRITAMNLMLHGIADVNLFDADIFKTSEVNITSAPVLIISNLYFTNIEKKLADENSSTAPDTGRKDISLLNDILKKLATGGRAAIIIRDYILYNNLPEVKEIRQQLLDGYAIDAVINLPDKPGSAFSGACLILFHLPVKGNSDNVWFYKMKPALTATHAALSPVKTELASAGEEGSLKHNKTNIESESPASGKAILSESFFVPLDEIKGNNHILAYNFYKRNTIPDMEVGAKNIPGGNSAPVLKPVASSNPLIGISKKIKFDGFFIDIKKKVKLRDFLIDIKKKVNTNDVLIKIKKKLNTKYSLFDLKEKLKLKDFHTGIKKKLNAKGFLVDIKKKVSTKDFRIDKPVINGLLIISIFGLCIAGPFFINKSKAPAKIFSGTKTIIPVKVNSLKDSEGYSNGKEKRILTPAQIKAIIDDTSGIINFDEEAAKENDAAFDSSDNGIEKTNNRKTNKNEAQPLLNSTGTSFPQPKYTVVETAYFHDKPNGTATRKIYLDPLRKNVLTALKDSNGFIYIIYTNKIGIISKGWIDKKYLRKVQ
jgi:type I restriction enzyme M protein